MRSAKSRAGVAALTSASYENAGMKDDRLRSPVEANYVEAIGRAAYTFASLEWRVSWSCEQLAEGSLLEFRDGNKGRGFTAGAIGTRFRELVRDLVPADAPEKPELLAIADRFKELVNVRNAILHGHPCTSPDKEQRLAAEKIFNIVEIPDLEHAADEFVALDLRLGEIYFRYLVGFRE